MNKPAGVVSATDDLREKTVLSLLPENYATKGLFPAGRLDKDTVGLLVLTNDGKNAHRLLSPKHHVEKEYYVECDGDFEEGDIEVCLKGVTLDGELTKPCILKIDPQNKNCAHMILTEGKYHEIKRMMHALGSEITYLERISFGPLTLPADLERGEWRELTPEEEKAILDAAK
jgi:16S rRNA pseudouridine516 synthase